MMRRFEARIAMKRLRALAWACLATAVARADDVKLETNYKASSIEVAGEAWGFIPADFAFRSFEAEIAIDDSGKALAAAEFRFSYLDLSSGSRARDKRIHEWLEAERFPEGRFLLERVEWDADGKLEAVGQLTLHGVTREARFGYALERELGAARLDAVAQIDYRQWGLPTLRVLVFSVDPVLEIRIRIAGMLAE